MSVVELSWPFSTRRSLFTTKSAYPKPLTCVSECGDGTLTSGSPRASSCVAVERNFVGERVPYCFVRAAKEGNASLASATYTGLFIAPPDKSNITT